MRRLAARGYLKNRQKTHSESIRLDYSCYMIDTVGYLDAFETVLIKTHWSTENGGSNVPLGGTSHPV
jgi:hypothetical protein